MKPQALIHVLVLASAGLVLAACTVNTNPDAARVDCGTPGPHGVDCTIKRTAGNGSFEACWDLVISCSNKGEMSGGACHKVSAAESIATETMPVKSFSNQAGCDVPTSGKVERLKITTL